MNQFHSLSVAAKAPETNRAFTMRLALTADVAAAFSHAPGQHVVLRAFIDGSETRRTYSVCAGSTGQSLILCIRSDAPGRMSAYLRDQVQPGSKIDVFPPTGRFIPPAGAGGANFLAIAAGVGLTPILQIVSHLLTANASARVTLLYCNRDTDSVLFSETLQDLKDRYLSRLSLHFFMSREPQEVDFYNGRIDAAKIREAASFAFDPRLLDAVFMCAPQSMMTEIHAALVQLGVASSSIHVERFVSPASEGDPGPAHTQIPAAASIGATAIGATAETPDGPAARVTVRMDGRVRTFQMPRDGSVSLLDAAGRAGIDLPYSCKGGVCSTCRTHLSNGSVQMALNYALEDSEVEAGFVLTCQSVPTSAEIELDYDTR